jgi:hypothetical protein
MTLSPFRFADQPCLFCGEIRPVEELVVLLDARGRLLGFHCDDCPPPDLEPDDE